ncbi:M20/M25/M40 family metallo-hydrolase [Rhodocytophaga rosea]|uniref:M20/M25/M40 family metallo-hydrolase n=1 Tax=Rhodocytophaga rosea TaxID=2704465 RepID=A0A6C0GBL7_9BACT|nr:M28 family metallopeptidase [Rhodocytophaga rosea]QHT65331.1 M20/M25/M40 family metallo-hydrolase [Rhodocytophaga rosea]
MKIIFFELEQTLIDKGRLIPGVVEVLSKLQSVQDSHNEVSELALISCNNQENIDSDKRLNHFHSIVKDNGILHFFEPLSEKITFPDNGHKKISENTFRDAINKIRVGLSYHHTIFISANQSHVTLARSLGMTSIHYKGTVNEKAEIDNLDDLLALINRLLLYSPCGKRLNEAKGFTISHSNKSKKIDSEIKSITERVDTNQLLENITKLTEFGTRWSYSPEISKVPIWIFDQFQRIGYSIEKEIQYQPFELPNSQPQMNVLCGNKDKDMIIVCSHYDSISETPSFSAPGADDNASGVAATLELARIFRNIPLKRNIMFAVFGGEEQGLYGSAACAEKASQEKWPIDVVINLDMISYKQTGALSKIIVEYDQGNKNSNNDAAAKAFGLTMAQAATDYTSLEVAHTDIWNSDYIPFEAKGFACIGAYNATDNPFYHKVSDTIDKIDITHLAEVVKMVAATILILGK